ncbi:FkbM family methyltransferase [Cellulomonas sp. ATA003]|uniref:FkbM family methyltransferase n=1 Tax=Cellulomonas sp. ATA003 TaxID=3073064 RepID=UPI0028731E5A|nr:FkbM family methyltransferase [Cellulomonas sp. ATA003]WNB86319.1 FkbM family methyltransferase [Cellulomonas sp. ATA003]
MPSDAPFISYAQNREDVVLWRALGHVPRGRYVEVGANDPTTDSITRAFYDRGWTGITVEPVQEFADAHRAQRPADTLIQAVVTDEESDHVVLHEVPGTGLSSIVDSVGSSYRDRGEEVVDHAVPATRLSQVLADHGGTDQTVHFLVVDTEGAEPQVLASLDLRQSRPWVLVIESTAPNSSVQTHEVWEPDVLAAGYRFCLFDGLSRFYVAEEHAEALAPALSYPACVLDRHVAASVHDLLQERQTLLQQIVHWRTTAITAWGETAAKALATRAPVVVEDREGERRALAELDAMRRTVSWRLTGPLRLVRRVAGAAARAAR